MEELDIVFEGVDEAMKKAVRHLESELRKINTGKASPVVLEGVKVDYYGSSTPLSQVSNVKILDPRTLLVTPWEKNLLADIERAIINANLGLNPSNDGENIIIPIPMLTEERRRDLAKRAKGEGEHSRVGLRKARHEALNDIKDLVSDGLSEDLGKTAEKNVEEMAQKYNKLIIEILDVKEKDIMTV